MDLTLAFLKFKATEEYPLCDPLTFLFCSLQLVGISAGMRSYCFLDATNRTHRRMCRIPQNTQFQGWQG